MPPKTVLRNTKLPDTSVAKLLFGVVLLLPLVYIPNNEALTGLVRAIVLGAVMVTILYRKDTRTTLQRNYQYLPPLVKGLILVLLASTLLTVATSPNTISLLEGTAPQYIGIFMWFGFVILGLFFMPHVESFMLAKRAAYSIVVVLLFSLIVNLFYVLSGVRFAGLIQDSSGMAVYATVGTIVALHQIQLGHNKTIGWALLLIGILTTLATQSKVGYIMVVLLLVWGAIIFLNKKLWISVLLAGLSLVVSLLPAVYPHYFVQLNNDNLRIGVTERLATYRLLYGKSKSLVEPSDLTDVIEANKYTIPEEISKSLNQQAPAFSRYGLFVAVGHYLGIAVAIALLLVVLVGLRKMLASGLQRAFRLIIVVLMLGAVLYTPNTTLTVLLFMSLFALFADEGMMQQSTTSRKATLH